jgi:hypothetical protein
VNKLIVLFSWVALSVCLDAQITLGTTVGTFGVLAGSTVTSTSTAGTVVIGSLGVSPGTAITGITGIAPGGPGIVTGTIHSGDAVAATAQSELTAAYNAVAVTASTATWNTDLGGHTFVAGGVYTASTSLGLTGTVTLDCTSNPSGQIIFKIGSTLTTATNSNVNLLSCLPANIFWLVGSSATLGTYSSFSGNILAHDAITLTTGASLQGRALARGAAVTLDDNAITMPATLGGGTGGGPPVSGGSGLPSAPAPSSLILVALALVCAGVYQARKRLPKLLGRS